MKISDLENNIKIKKREAKEKIKEVENIYQNDLTYIKSKSLSLTLIFFIIAIIFASLPLNFLPTLAPTIVYIFTLIKNKKKERKMNQFYANEIAQNKIDLEMYEEIIDTCVLYKDFLKEKTLSSEDLNQILCCLSPYMGEELLPVYSKLNKQEEPSNNKELLPSSCYNLGVLLMNIVANIHVNLFTIQLKSKEKMPEKVEKIEEQFQKLTESTESPLDERALLVKVKDFYSLLDATNEILFEMNQSQTRHLQKEK